MLHEKTMKETEGTGVRPGQVIDADAVQAAASRIRNNKPQREIIIAEEQEIVV